MLSVIALLRIPSPHSAQQKRLIIKFHHKVDRSTPRAGLGTHLQTCVRVSYQLGETDALLVGQVNEILEEFTSYKVSSSDVLISNCHSGIDTVGTLQQNRPDRAVNGCKELPRLLSIPMVNHRADLGY